MPSSNLMLCCPLLLPPSILPNIRVFSNESTLHMSWPKYWSFSFSTSPSSEYLGLISFRMDWFDLFIVQGTLNSLLQDRSSKASILLCSAFFTVQLPHPHMTTGKPIAWLSRSLLAKVMSLFFNTLSSFVIAILPRSKRLLFCGCSYDPHWFWSPRKWNLTLSTFSPLICHEVIGLDAMILVFWMLSVKPAFSLSSFTLMKGLFRSSSLSLSVIDWYHLYICCYCCYC